uniref:Uncharacterized protein n=1 Tax=Oryza sativa subsp. japonica TaxID=39947 RepID=Q6F2N4_ORYSJ|nr:unknown protein [Oryza sativa Japonica Group]AAU44271.1 unknown protein [Oryza sativa Japonica Group]
MVKGADAPFTQSFLSYLLLALVYGPVLLHRQRKFLMPWYWYLALAFIDVQGNCLAIKAYHYSYITSVNLLNCWTITWVMILTRFALGTRYSLWQFVGAGTCMTGLALVLLSDSNYSDVQDESKRPLLGDALIIVATFCFAFSNVGEIGLFIGFAVASLVFSSIAPFVLKVNWLYYLAFAVVAIGLIIYSINFYGYGIQTNQTKCILLRVIYEARVQMMRQLQVQWKLKLSMTMNNFYVNKLVVLFRTGKQSGRSQLLMG